MLKLEGGHKITQQGCIIIVVVIIINSGDSDNSGQVELFYLHVVLLPSELWFYCPNVSSKGGEGWTCYQRACPWFRDQIQS